MAILGNQVQWVLFLWNSYSPNAAPQYFKAYDRETIAETNKDRNFRIFYSLKMQILRLFFYLCKRICLTNKRAEIFKRCHLCHTFHCCYTGMSSCILITIYNCKWMNGIIYSHQQPIWLKRIFAEPRSQCFHMAMQQITAKPDLNLQKQ